MAGMEWISVTDRLPDELSRVLAVTAERGITIAWCRRERLGDLVWVTLDDYYGENVTHWLPLPEPPEVK
jgi:peptidoglycan/xylan/chitin deacetylase (PgdA/CDA1 family)